MVDIRPSLADKLLLPEVLEAIPDAVAAVNQDGIIIQVNSQAETMFGYTRDELIGRPVEILVPDARRPQHRSHRLQYHHEPKARRMGSGLDLYGRRRDGSEFAVEISLSPVSSSQGTVVLSAVRDLSHRKRIEQELRQANEELEKRKSRELRDSQNRLALIVDSTQDAIIGENLDGIVTHWNTGAAEMFGYTATEMIGRPLLLLAAENRRDEVAATLDKVRLGQRVGYFESVHVRKDGEKVDVSITVSPIHDADGKVIGASTIARNISAQKKVEDQFRQAQKLEAIGRLAGGVAHDFNNILGIITACSEMARKNIEPKGMEYLDYISQAAKRGAGLTQQLLAFSRKQPAKSQVFDLRERLRDLQKLLRPLMGDDVEVVVSSGRGDAFVMIDPGHLDQVVVNLAVNARDAMPKGGKLVIETKQFICDEPFAQQHPPMKVGEYVMLAVSDSGTGMDPATLSRLFEPFFTTKPAGKGSGLGLATVYGIVNQAQGAIFVYTELGQGTSFKIYLPSARPQAEGPREFARPGLPPRRDGTTVLFAEDEPMLRQVTRTMLEAHGYKVLDAEHGVAALELAISYRDPIDLVLTDVVMKGMTGPELVLRLMERRPHLKVVYLSGYTGEILSQRGLGDSIRLLDKPFTQSDLLYVLDAALNE